MLIGIIGWIILGLIAGFIASKVANLRDDDPGLGIGVGAIGAVIGGWLYSFFSGNAVTSFNVMSLVVAAIGASVFLVSWHVWRRRAVTH